MADKLRVGVLGLTHDHVWGNLDDLVDSELGELVAAADVNPELLERVQEEYDCQHAFEYYETMLDEMSLDAVYIFADNATGTDLAVMAADRGLHIMTEKPMAATLEGANRMLAAAAGAGVELMVNWPFAWSAGLQEAMSIARSGGIGEIFSVKYRAAHAGPKELGCSPYFYEWLYDGELNGAGALMDYCCYGAALTRYVAGPPSRVTGVTGNLQKEYITLEDNAVIIMQGPRAISTSEASWTQIGHLTSYVAVFYGSDGTLVVEPGDDGRVLLATREEEDGVEIDVPLPPPEQRSATDYFLGCIASGTPVEGLCSARVGRDAQEILEAALISARTGASVSLPLPIP